MSNRAYFRTFGFWFLVEDSFTLECICLWESIKKHIKAAGILRGESEIPQLG